MPDLVLISRFAVSGHSPDVTTTEPEQKHANNVFLFHSLAVMAEGKIRVEDHLVDANNKPIQVKYPP